jgi:uncharacterized membrane protein YphA (DoxX/SURF4 family)
MNIALWIIQILLALLFVFAGAMKLILPIDEMIAKGPPNQIIIPGLLLRFIGVCELLGGLGLVLPGIFRIKTGLTPLAAAGLTIIMIGAVVLTVMGPGVLMAISPTVTGILAAFVAYGRWKLVPLSDRSSNN